MNWHRILPACIIAVVTPLIYWPSLHYAFQFDDLANITRHFAIRHNSFGNLFFNGTRWISYWINSIHYGINKFDPFSYRVFNVCLHTTNALLVFFILYTALTHLRAKNFFSRNALPLSFITALLFALHPVQTQTVSYVIQGQLEGLAAFFILAMTICLLAIGFTKNFTGKIILGSTMLALALLSCGTKEIAIISPVLFLLVDWFFIAQGQWESFKKRLVLHALISLAIVGCYLYMLKPQFFTDIIGLKRVAKNNIGNVITQEPTAHITPWIFFISQFKVILHYLAMFVWPFGISVEYDWVLSKGFFEFDSFAPFLVLMGIFATIAMLLVRNRTHLAAFGLLWFFVCIGPRSSIIPSPELLVDYKTYLASVGWLFILAAALIYGAEKIISFIAHGNMKNKQLLYGSFTSLLIVGLSTSTLMRNTVWRSGLDFWGNVLKNAPGKARAYNNYGVELSQHQKKFKEAIPYFLKAIKMDAKYPDPHNNLAVAYAALDQIDMAMGALKNGLRINPYYPEGYNNLASFLLQKKEYEQAEKMLNTALRLRPHYGKAWFNMGRMHLTQDNKEKAWECFKNCCTKADLDNEFGFNAYARVSFALKKYDDAIFAYKKLLEFNQNNRDAWFNLANSYHFTQEFAKAESLYQQLLTQNPNDAQCLHNLGETYVKTDRYEKALATFNKLPAAQRSTQTYLRMAACHEKMGNPQQAHTVLTQLAQQNSTGPLAQTTKLLLSQLEKKYKLKPA